jgi:hypothetical protein
MAPAGKPDDRNSAATDNKEGAIGDPSDIVESGTTAGGTAGIAEGGKESKSGICDIGTDMFFGMTGELFCEEWPDMFPDDTTIGTG